ncbi:MAG: chitobiase/beta-hexosaminidase C-terminal domain-containing protein [Tenuifilaceae bacterium]
MRLRLLLKTTALTALLLIAGKVGWGQILTFEFSALGGSEVTATSNTNNAGLTSSTISRGAGLTAAANGGRYNATFWALTSIDNAVAGNDYMEFTITPNAGNSFTVSSIYLQLQRSSTGPRGIAIRNSLDAYAANLDQEYAIVDGTTTQNFTFTFAQASSSSAVTYRVYMWAEAESGSGGIGDGTGDDIIVNGTVVIPDVTAPVWTATYPKTTNLLQTSTDLVFNCDEAGTAYYVVLANDATAPTPAEVKAGTASGGGAAIASGNKTITARTTEYTSNISGLTASTDYDIYVVAQDDEGTPNVQAAVTKVEIKTLDPDITAPIWTATYPKTANVAKTTLDLLYNIDEQGIAYFVVLANDATAPNSAEVKAGTASGGGAAIVAGSKAIAAATTEYTTNISGLTAGTDYDIYVVAQDDEGTPNVQAAPVKVEVATVPLSTVCTATSVVYNVLGTPTFTVGIPANVSVATFESNITPAALATKATFESDGTTPATGNVLNGYKLKITAEDGVTFQFYTIVVTPILSADATNNNVDNNIDITFTEDATWRAAITDVKVGATSLAAADWDKTVAGILTLKPSVGNALLTTSGDKTITVVATGYVDAVVSQTIDFGGLNTTNSTVGIAPAMALGGTSTVTLTAKDQYNNLIAGYIAQFDATITDANPTNDESFTINTVAYTASASDVNLTATNASGVSTFDIVLPGVVDGGDGLSVQVTTWAGVSIGSAMSYTAPVAKTATLTPATIAEHSLEGAVINIAILNTTFVATLDKANYTLNNAPVGLSIASIARVDDNHANVTLAYTDAGNDFDVDVTNFSITILAAELASAADLTSNDISLTATTEVAPTVTTNAAITSLGETTAVWGGDVSADGGELVSEKGLCWGLVTAPTTADSKTTEGAGTGAITGTMTTLTANTVYYVRAYATNSVNTAYGVEKSFRTLNAEPTNQVNTFAVTPSTTNLNISWVNNNGATPPTFYLIKASTSNNITSPVDAVAVPAENLVIGDNNGVKVVAATETSFSWTGLSAGTQYFFKIFPFTKNTTDELPNYNTTSAPAASGTTLSGTKEVTASTIGTLDAGNKKITNIPAVTTVDQLEAGITVSANATFDVLVTTGGVSATGTDVITNAMVVKITAQNGTSQEYVLQLVLVGELFFSQYLEGSGNNKALEIYNGTGASIDLSNYTIKASNNGSGWGKITLSSVPTDDIRYVLPLTGTLANGDVYIITNDQANTAIKAQADIIVTFSNTTNTGQGANIASFNGDDGIALFKNTTIVDQIGVETPDPGTAWNVAGVTNATAEYTLIRKDAFNNGGTDWTAMAGTDATSSEWVVYPQDYVGGLGSHKLTLPSASNDILTFTVPSQIGTSTINSTAKTIGIIVPSTLDRTALVATFTNSANSTVKVSTTAQVSGTTPNNFTNAVTYIVTAEGGNIKNWVITLTNASTAATVTSSTYTVDGTGFTITSVPYATTLATFKSNITPAANATFEVYQSDGTTVATDLATGYKLICTAQDGVTKITYTITVTPAKTGKDILTFSLPGQTGAATIADPNISVEVSNTADVTALIATYTLSDAASVKVGATTQVSGTTPNDFTNPVTYVVTAEDGSTKNWTVTVTKAATLSDATDILTFSVASVNATVNPTDHTVAVTLPLGTNVTALVATYSLSSGATAKVGTTTQVSGTTPNDFTSPVTYIITAENGSTIQNWTVTVTIASGSSDATVTSTVYSVNSTSNTISNVPFGATLAAFKANITPAANAIFEVYQTNGTTVATDLLTGYKLICTAQAGNTKTYTITVDAAPLVETFANYAVTGTSYADGTFLGIDGSTWTFAQCAAGTTEQIAAPSPVLGRGRTPVAEVKSGTIHGGIGKLGFKYMQAFTTAVSLDVYVNTTKVTTVTTLSTESKVVKTAIDIPVYIEGDFTIKFIQGGTGTGQVSIDDITWTAYAPLNPTVAAPQFSLVAGNYLGAQNVTITSATADAIIYYTLDGSTPTEASTLYSTPVAINSSATLKAKAFKAGMDPSPVTSAAYVIQLPTEVANIAALRAGTTDGIVVYKLTGEAILTFQQTNRNQKYIQDATGGILIDDAAGVITTAYNQYDGITGLTGRMSLYGGLIQFVPASNTVAATSTNNTVVPQVVTLTDLNTNYASYESELIKVQSVTFEATGTFAASQNMNISSGGVVSVFRTAFASADYIGGTIPTTAQNIVGLAGQYNGTAQITARNLADFSSATGINDNTFTNLSVYPNPFKDEIRFDATQNINRIVITSVTGQVMMNVSVADQVNRIETQNLPKGMYIVTFMNSKGERANQKMVKE